MAADADRFATLHAQLRAAREARGMSQHELARRLGITHQVVEKREAIGGEIKLSTLLDILKVLQVPATIDRDGNISVRVPKPGPPPPRGGGSEVTPQGQAAMVRIRELIVDDPTRSTYSIWTALNADLTTYPPPRGERWSLSVVQKMRKRVEEV